MKNASGISALRRSHELLNTNTSTIDESTEPIVKNLLLKKIAIIYSDARRQFFPTESMYLTEKDVKTDCSHIAKYINKIGIKTFLVRGDSNLPKSIAKIKPDLILNYAGSVRGQEHLACTIPAYLQLVNVPSNGSDLLCEALTYNKYLTKKFLKLANIPTPDAQLFFTAEDKLEECLRFPVISKLNEIHGSVEIDDTAVSENEDELRKRVKYLIESYKQPVLVENYIDGPEITAAVLENASKEVYLAKKIFPNKKKYNIIVFDEWIDTNKNPLIHEKYEDKDLEELVMKAFYAYKMTDIGKFDIRIDKDTGKAYIVDLATSPSYGVPKDGHPFSLILELYGISFMDSLQHILINIQNRFQRNQVLR